MRGLAGGSAGPLELGAVGIPGIEVLRRADQSGRRHVLVDDVAGDPAHERETERWQRAALMILGGLLDGGSGQDVVADVLLDTLAHLIPLDQRLERGRVSTADRISEAE